MPLAVLFIKIDTYATHKQSFKMLNYMSMHTVYIKVPVKSKLSMCSEFVTPQKNVLLATQPNLNDKKAGKYMK